MCPCDRGRVPDNDSPIALEHTTLLTWEGLLRAWEKVGDDRKDMYAYSIIRADNRKP